MKTTRSRQREQDKKNKDSEPTDQLMPDTLSSVPIIEQCAICMENLMKQEVGIPENCEHSFCLTCLIEWAKVIKKINLFLIKKKYLI
jgi:hypothetical protein